MLFNKICLVLTIIVFQPTLGNNPRFNELQKIKCLNPPRTARRVVENIKSCQDEVKNKLVQEAFSIMKAEGAQLRRPTAVIYQSINDNIGLPLKISKPYDNSNNKIIWPTYSKWSKSQTQINQSNNDQKNNYDISNYELIYMKPAQKRISRLLQSISRIDDISSGIYHPTLVSAEDKRIAGCLLHCVYAKNDAIDSLGWPTLDGLVDFYSEGVNEHDFFMATLRSVNLCLKTFTNKYRINRRKLPEKGESCDLAFDVFDCVSDQITDYCLDQFKS